jgi:Fe-S-cluster containining protein
MHPLQAAVRDISRDDRPIDQRTWSALRQLNDRHQCQRCGKCCTGQVVGMLGHEAVAIARHLQLAPSEFKRCFIERQAGKWLMIKRRDDDTCPFIVYDDDLKANCVIYEVRPETCRRFPWLTPLIMTGSKWPGVVVDDTLCSQMSRTFNAVRGSV